MFNHHSNEQNVCCLFLSLCINETQPYKAVENVLQLVEHILLTISECTFSGTVYEMGSHFTCLDFSCNTMILNCAHSWNQKNSGLICIVRDG